MDQELEKLRRAYLSDRSNENLGRDYERKWLRTQSFDLTNKVVDLKVVYEGVAMSGKTTNFEQLQRSYGDAASVLYVGSHEGDRILCFSIKLKDNELLGEWTGLTLRVGLYTVPGACYYQNTRRLLRQNSDCIVFIPTRMRHLLGRSKEQYDDVLDYMKTTETKDFPIVWQRNDGHPDSIPWDEVLRKHEPAPKTVTANAFRGAGVKETLDALLVEIVGDSLKRVALFPDRLKSVKPFAFDLAKGLTVESLG
ncbi:MAG: hypothetical protein P1V97_31535 [Planctomycetota bacterium]|nr:hypothetical protein [Planctomycetota bacterium]